MGVIGELGATLWKMFAADLPLSVATLFIIAGVIAADRSRLIGPPYAAFLLAGLVLAVFAIVVGLAIGREISKRTKL